MGFAGERVNILGVIELRTTIRTKPNIKIIDVRYLVIDSQAPYHMMLGRPSLNTLEAIVSTPYLALKFPVSATKVGVITPTKKKLDNVIMSH